MSRYVFCVLFTAVGSDAGPVGQGGDLLQRMCPLYTP
jgi:hypothetical protein